MKKGLHEDIPVVLRADQSEDQSIASNFTDRLKISGAFPNMSILINNLMPEDTGVYWCLYNQSQSTVTEGTGSVLLVVMGESRVY